MGSRSHPLDQGSAAIWRRERVLIVDDHPDTAELLSMALELSGHRCAIATHVEAALVILRDQAPDVALIDLGLPRVDGCELARRIRSSTGAAMWLIATGWFGDSYRERAQASGFDVFLPKPTKLDTLLKAIAASHTRV